MKALATNLAKTFDECLESILSDPQQQKEEGNEGLDTQIAILKSSFLELENHLRQVRLDALANRPLAVKEANQLLKRDIEIKKKTIAKYVLKLDEWDSKIPALIENGKKAVALRTDGTDFDSDYVAPPSPSKTNDQVLPTPTPQQPVVDDVDEGDDDDDDEEDEFEVVA